MNELLILFNIVCASASSVLNVQACTRAIEAATIQTGLAAKTRDLRIAVVKEAQDFTGVTPTQAAIAYTVGRYARTKKLSYTLPIRNTAITIQQKGINGDVSGSVNITLHF